MVNNTDIIKFAVVGCGNIGQRHIQHIINNKQAQLVATCDVLTNRSKEAIPHFTSIQDLLSSNIAIDVVNICTPNYLHASHTIAALQAHKHAVCEKPMAISTPECDAMIAAASKTEKTIFIVKQNRYNPPVAAVKELINKNGLGKIFFVNINCFWNRNEHYYNEAQWRGTLKQDGGIVFTQFSHFVDILYYLIGNVNVVQSIMHNFNHAYTEVEDAGTSTMRGRDNCIINFNYSTCATDNNMEGAITIIAEKGTLKIGGQYLNTIEYQKVTDYELPPINISAKSNDYGLYQGSMSNHDKVIQNVIDTLNGVATIMTNAQEGRAVVKIIEDIYKAK